MSLFPAYNPSTSKSKENEESGEDTTTANKGKNLFPWLENSSYNAEESNKQSDNADKGTGEANCAGQIDDTRSHKKKTKKKDKKERKLSRKQWTKSMDKSLLEPSVFEDDQFYEDKKQERGNLLVRTLHRPAVPRYDKCNCYFEKYKYLEKHFKKKRKYKRYFTYKKYEEKNSDDENDFATKEKEQLVRITEEFNRNLNENPGNVTLWLEYVNFQDTMSKSYKAGHSTRRSGGGRPTLERKLAILERALQSNPGSARLLEEKFKLIELMRPLDQVTEEYMQALIQDPGNLTIWRALIRATRNNVARCTVPGVLQLYAKAISRISQLKLHRPTVSVEQDILSLVLECGFFLQQAGLWEQLWTLLQMYLSLSLTASGQFSVSAKPSEDKLKHQENNTIHSGLPLSELWSRVEKLRAAFHFLPDNDCESDPQRVVFSEDITGLLRPLVSPELHLQLVVSVLMLLKVPLLPTRHSLLACVGLLHSPSAASDVEALLAVLHPTCVTSAHHCRYLFGAMDLVCEPQYVRNQPGQLEFLSWVIEVMQHCAELLPVPDAVIIHVWTLRLYGLLSRLHCLGLCSGPSTATKQAKSHAKQLLKQVSFRENLILYAEYALIEKNAGDLSKACDILETAATMSIPTASQQDVPYVFLCRRLVECLLLKHPSSERRSALRVLVALADQQPVSADPASETAVKRSALKWQQQTSMLMEQYSPDAGQTLTLAAAMTPHLLVEWLACHALFLSLTLSVWEAASLLQQHIDLIPNTSKTLGSMWVEQLYEVLVDLLYMHTVHTKSCFTLLRSTLDKALGCFSNNLSLLSTLADVETQSGGGGTPLWKLVQLFPRSTPLARLLLLLVVRYRISTFCTDSSTVSGGSNFLRNLLQQLIEEETTSQCSLIWRLYLQLMGATADTAQVKTVFYKSLQIAPWDKALYMDAAKFLPEELPEIQDLLIEKELRLHTSPEELEILRD